MPYAQGEGSLLDGQMKRVEPNIVEESVTRYVNMLRAPCV